ncbi:MAG: hypothetical protein KIT08_02745 [Anaerolineales bacterium]|nr:MAG: hypothetical protein KIT08_02745 [Anaerolineales bacterium]
MTRVERGEEEDTYTYDANGNMLQRVEDEVTWTQIYNAENRLTSVSDGEETWSFTYDGDGRRVRQVGPDGEVTLYLGGGAYEVRDAAGDTEVVKYYGIAGQRVALSGPDGLQFLLSDHLGSVSAVLDAAGNLLGQQRYTPFGEARFEAMLGTTDFGYTGQRLLVGTGLMDYNARFYAPGLGRWTQPDSIVPGAGNPQNINRFSYVMNNPINLADPSGHCASGKILDGQCLSQTAPSLGYRPQNAGLCFGKPCLTKAQNLRQELDNFVAPVRSTHDELIVVPGLFSLTPQEYQLVSDENGFPDLILMGRMQLIRNDAFSATSKLFPGSPLENSPADAFRHAYWNALMTREFGEEFARDFATAHETHPDSVREAAFMDLHNNQVGREIALTNPESSNAQLQTLVYEALRSGLLYVWDKNDIYFSDACPLCTFP